jgi:hypothetical protein
VRDCEYKLNEVKCIQIKYAKRDAKVIQKSPDESETGCPESESLTLESEYKSESSIAEYVSESESLKNGTRVGLESEYYKSA